MSVAPTLRQCQWDPLDSWPTIRVGILDCIQEVARFKVYFRFKKGFCATMLPIQPVLATMHGGLVGIRLILTRTIAGSYIHTGTYIPTYICQCQWVASANANPFRHPSIYSMPLLGDVCSGAVATIAVVLITPIRTRVPVLVWQYGNP